MNVTCTVNEKNSEAEQRRFVIKVYDWLSRDHWLVHSVLCVLWGVLEELRMLHGESMRLVLPAIAFLVVLGILRGRTRYVKTMTDSRRLLMDGGGEAAIALTDDYYEFKSGGNDIRVRWKGLGSQYLFLDDGVAVLLDGNPRLFLNPLPKFGADPAELRAVLENAGLKEFAPSRNPRLYLAFLAILLSIGVWMAFKIVAL